MYAELGSYFETLFLYQVKFCDSLQLSHLTQRVTNNDNDCRQRGQKGQFLGLGRLYCRIQPNL